MSERPVVTRLREGTYRVEVDGRSELVHVAGPAGSRWVHWNGVVYERPFDDGAAVKRTRQVDAHAALSAPMPATVRKVAVAVGARVAKGDTLIVLEAMKMELPLRAPSDGVVRMLRCREGELVQPGTTLVELE